MVYEYTRPAKIQAYKKQVAFLDCPTRYTIVEATTKAGKTVGCIVWLFEQALSPYYSFHKVEGNVIGRPLETESKDGCNYWWVAPVYSQAKIAFKRMKRYIQDKNLYKANETELTITLFNGAVICFKSGENSDNLYGDDVHAVVLDEATRMREESWFAVRSTITATKGPVKIIGNVKGTVNWVYKLAREAEAGKDNWSYFKLTAADAVEAGVLDQSDIDDAKDTLPNGVFLELYYAIPFVNSANKFAYSFETSKHVKKCIVNYAYPIYFSFDFNRNPICCGVYQIIEGAIHAVELVKLENSNIYKLCEYLKNKYMLADTTNIIVNGDASGNNGSAMVKDNLNYFRIIKAELGLTTGSMQQLSSNPSIAENQVLVNAVLEHVPHCIDPDNSQQLVFDLSFAEMLPDGTLKKGDRNDATQQLDALDTYRYFINRNFRQYLKGYK